MALGDFFAYVEGNFNYSRYLLLPHIKGAGEVLVFCAAMAGAGLAFVVQRLSGAGIYGDVGALAFGGALGTIAVIVRQELVLFIMGGVFVVETLSVACRWFYFGTPKTLWRGKRIL